MRISDYKQALKDVDDNDLENLVVRRYKKGIVLEFPDNPPEPWTNFIGAVSQESQQTSTKSSTREVEGHATGSSAKRFLAGFVADMNAAFGEAITKDCISAHYPDKTTPLTARQVKQIIQSAEKQAAIAGVNNLPQPPDFRKGNDRVILDFLNGDQMAEILFPEPNKDEAAILQASGRKLLLEKEATLFKNLVTAICRAMPEYSSASLTDEMLSSAAQTTSRLLNDLAQLLNNSSAGLGLAWTLLDNALQQKGLSFLLNKWPAYAAGASVFTELNTIRGMKSVRDRAYEISPTHAWSEQFFTVVAAHHLELFVNNIDEIVWSPKQSDTRKYQHARNWAVSNISHLLERHLEELSELDSVSALTPWQKCAAEKTLNAVPLTLPSFRALVKLTESLDPQLSALLEADNPDRVLAALTSVCKTLSRWRPAEHGNREHLVTTALALAVATLTPAQALTALQTLESQDERMREQLEKLDFPLQEMATTLVAPTLKQRALQASDKFQLLCNDC